MNKARLTRLVEDLKDCIEVEEKIDVLPMLGAILLLLFTITGAISWHFLLLGFLFAGKRSLVINKTPAMKRMKEKMTNS